MTGLCECGCGQATTVATKTDRARGWVKGQPKRFIRGHARTGRYSDPVERIMTRSMRVDQGHSTPCLVFTGGLLKTGYAAVSIGGVNGAHKRIHRLIWEHHHGEIPADREIDHVCHNPRTCSGGPSCPHRSCHEITHLALRTHLENVQRGSKCIPLRQEVPA